MARPLRCPSKKHAELVSEDAVGVIEVKCSSRFCGARRGRVILHQFDLKTGEVGTRSFADPIQKERQEKG